MHKIIVIAVLVAAFFASTAQAGAGSARGCKSWESAQTATGGAFGSRQECVKAKEVFTPTLSVSSPQVFPGQVFQVQGSGFHAVSATTLSFAVVGQSPYFSVTKTSNVDGSWLANVTFEACADSPFPVPLTLTLTDASGVHAQTGVVLC